MAYVYVIAKTTGGQFSGPCKIGLANDPSRRARSIQTASPFQISVYATIGPMHRDVARTAEKAFHTYCMPTVMYGEWFRMEPDFALYLLCGRTIEVLVKSGLSAQRALGEAFRQIACADHDVESGYTVAEL